MSEIILRIPCQGTDCDDSDLKGWVCGRCNNGKIFLTENGIVKCNKCDYKKDYFSEDFYCNKCKEKKNNSNSNYYRKFGMLLKYICSEVQSRKFLENVGDSLIIQLRKYRNS